VSVSLATPFSPPLTSLQQSSFAARAKVQTLVEYSCPDISLEASKFDLAHSEPDAEPDRAELGTCEAETSGNEDEEYDEHERIRSLIDALAKQMATTRDREALYHRDHRSLVEQLESKCLSLGHKLHSTKPDEPALTREIPDATAAVGQDTSEHADKSSTMEPCIHDARIEDGTYGEVDGSTKFEGTAAPAHERAPPLLFPLRGARPHPLAGEISAHTAAHDAQGLAGLPGGRLWVHSDEGPPRPLSPVVEDPVEERLSPGSPICHAAVGCTAWPQHQLPPDGSVVFAPPCGSSPPVCKTFAKQESCPEEGANTYEDTLRVPDPHKAAPFCREPLTASSASARASTMDAAAKAVSPSYASGTLAPTPFSPEMVKLQEMTTNLRDRELVDKGEIAHLEKLVSSLSMLVARGRASPFLEQKIGAPELQQRTLVLENVVIGISGVSRSGKGWVCKGLLQAIEAAGKKAIVIAQGDFLFQTCQVNIRGGSRASEEEPECINHEKFAAAIYESAQTHDVVLAAGSQLLHHPQTTAMLDHIYILELDHDEARRRWTQPRDAQSPSTDEPYERNGRNSSALKPEDFDDLVWPAYLRYMSDKVVPLGARVVPLRSPENVVQRGELVDHIVQETGIDRIALAQQAFSDNSLATGVASSSAGRQELPDVTMLN
jgi:hypothetical protein